MKNVKEILSIDDEFVIGLSKDQFMNVLKYVYKDPSSTHPCMRAITWFEMSDCNTFCLTLNWNSTL